jgi:RNA recognition motif-containing protein
MSAQAGLADYPPVFIGGLPSSCDWQTVYNYLQQFGEIKSLLVPRYKRTGRIKGYAKARFATQESLDLVLAQYEHTIGGLRVGVFLWKSKAEYAPVMDELRARMVHVKYDFTFSEIQLREYFSDFGPVQLIEMPYNPITRELRNFSYVVFCSSKSAFLVAQIRNHSYLGHSLVCEMSRRIHFGYSQGNDHLDEEHYLPQEQCLSSREVRAKCNIEQLYQNANHKTQLISSTENIIRLHNVPHESGNGAGNLATLAIMDPNQIQGFWFKPTSKYYYLDRPKNSWDQPMEGQDSPYIRINIGHGVRWN